MKAVIYANGSSTIGLGHIMRTLTIAKELKNKGIIVEYVTDRSDENAVKLIKDNGFNIIHITSILDYLLNSQKIIYDLAIIDDYNIEERDINKFYNIARKIIYIDDLAKFKEYNMDLLINTSIEALNIDYKGKAKKLLGSKYALLRDEFKHIKYKLPKPNVERIMITLGGGDENNITKCILDLFLDNYNDIEYNVVLGNSYKYKDFMIENYKDKNVNFHINTKNMAELMLNSDLVISAGGNTLYELCACGTPTIAVIISDNQGKFVQGISRITGMDYINLFENNLQAEKDNFVSIVERNIEDYSHRIKISKRMFNLLDGEGSKRIVNEIIKFFWLLLLFLLKRSYILIEFGGMIWGNL